MQFTKQLPIGVSTFSRFKEENLIYVDKTKTIFTIANKAAGKFFLSRPRRFGKSLLVSTLHSLFAEGISAFSGFAIENLWKDKTYQVIYLDFSKVRSGKLNDFINDLNSKLLMALKEAKDQMEKQKYGLELLPGTKLHYFAFIIDAKTKTITYQ